MQTKPRLRVLSKLDIFISQYIPLLWDSLRRAKRFGRTTNAKEWGIKVRFPIQGGCNLEADSWDWTFFYRIYGNCWHGLMFQFEQGFCLSNLIQSFGRQVLQFSTVTTAHKVVICNNSSYIFTFLLLMLISLMKWSNAIKERKQEWLNLDKRFSQITHLCNFCNKLKQREILYFYST